MAKIIRVVRENLPPVRFIGKKYKNSGTGMSGLPMAGLTSLRKTWAA